MKQYRKIRKGDRVKIRREYRDAGDDKFEWFALEDEDGGRVKIGPKLPGFTIQPGQVVETRMLE